MMRSSVYWSTRRKGRTVRDDLRSEPVRRWMRVVGIAGVTLALSTVMVTAVVTCVLLREAAPMVGAAIDDQDASRLMADEATRYADLWMRVITTWAWGTLAGFASVVLGISTLPRPETRRMGVGTLVIAGLGPVIVAGVSIACLQLGAIQPGLAALMEHRSG